MAGQTNNWLATTNYIKKCIDQEKDFSMIETLLKSDANALKQLASTDSDLDRAVKKDLAVNESVLDNKWMDFTVSYFFVLIVHAYPHNRINFFSPSSTYVEANGPKG